MTKKLTKHLNLHLIILLAYFLTGVTGVVNIIPMLIKASAMQYFHAPAYVIGYVFAFYMFGMLFGCLLNGYILKFIRIRTDLLYSALVYLICVIILYFTRSLYVTGFIVAIMGAIGGITLTLPYMIVVHLLKGRQRSSTLSRVDLMYSVGALITPPYAGYLLAQGYSWQTVFAAALILFAVIALISLATHLPNVNTPHEQTTIHQDGFSAWNLNIYLVGIAMFFYVASYMGFNYWAIHYATDQLHTSNSVAFMGESAFWWLYAVGCLLSSFLVKHIELHKYMLVSSSIALLSYGLLCFADNASFFVFTMGLLGLSCSALYSTSLSYGTHQVLHPSPRVVSFLVAIATVGTTVSQFLSSFFIHQFGMSSIVLMSTLFMAVYLVMFLITLSRRGATYLKTLHQT